MSERTEFNAVKERLADAGFNLVAAFRVGELDSATQAVLPDFGTVPKADQSLVVVASGGNRLWAAMSKRNMLPEAGSVDPVDHYSISEVSSSLDVCSNPAQRALLYPMPDSGIPAGFAGPAPAGHVSLQKLGSLAGWHQSSPMGIGIHPEHGLWFAYRALVLLDLSVDSERTDHSGVLENDTCARCKTRDCVSSCPASAITYAALPDMQACADFRLSENSVCQTQCLARKSCPVGKAMRYHDDQIRYHYTISLDSLRRRIKNV